MIKILFEFKHKGNEGKNIKGEYIIEGNITKTKYSTRLFTVKTFALMIYNKVKCNMSRGWIVQRWENKSEEELERQAVSELGATAKDLNSDGASVEYEYEVIK